MKLRAAGTFSHRMGSVSIMYGCWADSARKERVEFLSATIAIYDGEKPIRAPSIAEACILPERAKYVIHPDAMELFNR